MNRKRILKTALLVLLGYCFVSTIINSAIGSIILVYVYFDKTSNLAPLHNAIASWSWLPFYLQTSAVAPIFVSAYAILKMALYVTKTQIPKIENWNDLKAWLTN